MQTDKLFGGILLLLAGDIRQILYYQLFVSVAERISLTRRCPSHLCDGSVSCYSYIATCASRDVAVMNNTQPNFVSIAKR